VTTPSALRRLARDYFEGRLQRADYRQQRKLLIDAWVDGRESGETPAPEQGSDCNDLHVTVEEQPDGDALESAFASRNREAGIIEPEHSPPSLIPDFSQLPGEGTGGADLLPGASAPADQSGSDRAARYLLWLLPVLVLSVALAVLLFISW
jgi:hypothetical protein